MIPLWCLIIIVVYCCSIIEQNKESQIGSSGFVNQQYSDVHVVPLMQGMQPFAAQKANPNEEIRCSHPFAVAIDSSFDLLLDP